MSGRRILFNFLKEIGLELGDKIEEQGWIHFCSLNLPIYPTLVRNFYENLKVGDDYLESQVKGKRIILSEELLSSLYRMPHSGSKYLELEDKSQALEAIRGTYNSKGNIVASSLSLEMRLLHNFISRIFIPCSGRFDWDSERDLAFMEKVVRGEPINLPFIMINQIKETTRKTNTCLSYGMAFTVIFEAAHISLSGEDKKEPHHTDTYTAKSLIRMGYSKIDGEWKKRDLQEVSSSSEQEEDTEEENVPTEETSPVQEDIPTAPSQEAAPPQEEHQEHERAEQSPSVPLMEILIKKMTEDITHSIQTSLASFSQSLEGRINKLNEDVSQIQRKINSLEASSSSLNTPSVNLEHIDAIKQIMTQGVERMSSELRTESLRISKLKDCRRFEDEYASNLGTLRGEFGRMRGAADNFTKLQADALKELREDSKHLTSEVNQIWHFL